jgi:hypothetical protein
MSAPVYYVGTTDEAGHHARPLADAFDLRIVPAEEVVGVAQPGDVCVFFNEYFPRFRDACHGLKAKGCATLYAIDGILEWRNSWELPEHGTCCLWVMRPVLSHKVACIGRSQARVLESWGNLGKCEVVGVPRFDLLAGRSIRKRKKHDRFRLLVLTAKCPGFTNEQVACTTRSLVDLKHWLTEHPQIDGTLIEPVWRITQGLEKKIGVENQLHDTTGADLASVLQTVDAVITTPSTAMLEGMLHQVPVALLDYHNRPHYVPAAWEISAPEHLDQIIPELLSPAPARLLYQQSILSDALESRTPATPRMVELIGAMQREAAECLSRGQPLTFSRRLLSDPQDGHHWPEPGCEHPRLFPDRFMFTGAGRKIPLRDARSSAAAGASGGTLEGTPGLRADSPAAAEELLERLRQKDCDWRQVADQLGLHWHKAKQQVTAKVQRELDHVRRELHRLQRKTLAGRLQRAGQKVLRLIRPLPQSPRRNARRDKAA